MTRKINSQESTQSQSWFTLALSAAAMVFAVVWTVHGCEDNTADYKQSAYDQSTLNNADLSIWYKEKNLTDSTYMDYLAEIGFYDPELNRCKPEKLVDFKAKQIDELINKLPNKATENYSLGFYQGVNKYLLIAGAINRDPIERTAFIQRHYLAQDYSVQRDRLDYLNSLLPSDFGSYPMAYIFELIDETNLLYYFQHIGYSCGRKCRRAVVYPENITHFPDNVLNTLIKKYEDKYNWAELTFTSSGTYYNGFKKALEFKQNTD